ncbi:MAG: response regulator [Gemmatimonadota bacterium]|nr:response regulator [Gemmatimonadota bacterium]
MTEPHGRSAAHRISQFLRGVQEPLVRRVLVVDDEESIRSALAKFLRTRGYEVTVAENGDDALAAVRTGDRYTLMLCDVRMPGMTGIELVPQVLDIDGDLAVMMLTAVNDAGTATEALASGAMDYLMKPIELKDLEKAIERILHRRALIVEQRNVERLIREEVALRTDELTRERRAVQEMSVAVIDALINAQEAKDVYLRGHSQRVADLAASIASAMSLDDELVEDIRLAGRVHDVGKIGIREAVLNKPGALTPEEFDHVKESVRLSVEILSPLKHIARVLPYIQDHQEHWDGSGYPRGLAGPEIAIGGRILHVADAYDAMTSRRAFREPKQPQEAIEILSTQTGGQFDPDVFQAFKSVVQRRKSLVFIDLESLGA